MSGDHTWHHPDHQWDVAERLRESYGYAGDGDASGLEAAWDDSLCGHIEFPAYSGVHFSHSSEEYLGFSLYVTTDYGAALGLMNEAVVTNTAVHEFFTNGEAGLLDAIYKMSWEMETIPTIPFRYSMLMSGMALEIKTGMQLTGKAPASSAIVKRDYGVKKHISKKNTMLVLQALIMVLTDIRTDFPRTVSE
jgi:hypothetical protein